MRDERRDRLPEVQAGRQAEKKIQQQQSAEKSAVQESAEWRWMRDETEILNHPVQVLVSREGTPGSG